jgi:hypothetical protein
MGRLVVAYGVELEFSRATLCQNLCIRETDVWMTRVYSLLTY